MPESVINIGKWFSYVTGFTFNLKMTSLNFRRQFVTGEGEKGEIFAHKGLVFVGGCVRWFDF